MPWIDASRIEQLNQPGHFEELAAIATECARQALPETDVEIFHDSLWAWRFGAFRFADPGLFDGPEPLWERRAATRAKYLRDVNDYWFHVYKPREGDVIADIGAGRGEDVYVFSEAVGPPGKVWAFEPHPVSFEALRLLCHWNALGNVTALNCACVAAAAELQIETLPVWESNYVRRGEPSATSHPVSGFSFDDLARRHSIDRIDFLKMNIEGAERDALPGCREALQRARFVCVAAHDFRAERGEGESFRTLDLVKETLREAGFELVTRHQDPRYYVRHHVHGFRK